MRTSPDSRRVVVTGVGCATALGLSADSTWRRLLAGESGITGIEGFDASAFTSRIAAEIKRLEPAEFMDPKEARRTDRSVQLAACAAKDCLQGLPLSRFDGNRVGVVIGSGVGGIATLEKQHSILLSRGPDKISPFFIPMMIADMSAGQLSIVYGFRGPNYAAVSACASSGNAIADSFLLIKAGLADAMLTGGTEASVTALSLGGFCALRALSTRNDEPEKASRPFDAKRDGFVLGEGAGIVFLEELGHAVKHGSPILAELVGVGLTGDAYHMTAPPPNGEGAVRAMRTALEVAGMSPSEVDYVNAHGTSTELNDASETAAIKEVFGDHARRLKISSTKSMVGHLLGAAAAVEFVACVLSIRDRKVHPTINQEFPDPQCDLDYVPNKAVDHDVNVALSNSFGFGGHNCSLVLRRCVTGD
ncbi:MAG: beta-ketoacyl-[acyl-carrier-protein] synthase [Candidatus Krumholzibacteriota bacterium]|nr:beta-ketoacyl-[acyl-carrier-protein] synthase [Candidatus Krumholzibacteriota bacterium]